MSDCIDENIYEEIHFEEETNNCSIYKALNKKTGNFCCLKIINKNQLKLGNYNFLLKQLKREEEINKLCNSENIVNFYNKFETQDNIVFELELCDTNLEEYLYYNGKFKEDKEFFKEIVLQLANALMH